jgi:hypothetical protein
MIEFLKNYTISDNTAFVLFSITILMDLVFIIVFSKILLCVFCMV